MPRTSICVGISCSGQVACEIGRLVLVAGFVGHDCLWILPCHVCAVLTGSVGTQCLHGVHAGDQKGERQGPRHGIDEALDPRVQLSAGVL